MTLRTRTLLIIFLTLLGLLLGLTMAARAILLDSFLKLEEQHVHQQLIQGNNAIGYDLVNLEALAFDWSNWDDTYGFVVGDLDYDSYVSSNLVDETFISLRLNFMVYTNPEGQVVYKKGFDLENQVEISVPNDLLDQLTGQRLLGSYPDIESKHIGILMLADGPVMVVSRPILTSGSSGPIHGAYILGRFLNNAEIQRFSEQTQLLLAIFSLASSPLPSDVEAVKSVLSTPDATIVRPINDQVVAGYQLIPDIYGQPALILKVESDRSIYQQGRTSLYYLVLSILVVGLVFAAVILITLEKQVLARLAALSRNVGQIGQSGYLSARMPVHGADELSSLSGAINQMLANLEHSEQILGQSEGKFRSLVENSPTGIAIINQNRLITYANEELCRLVGFPMEEVIGRDFESFLAAESAACINSHYLPGWENQNVPPCYDVAIVRKDGGTRHVEVSASRIPSSAGKSFTIAQVLDITERKQAEDEIRRRNRELALLNRIISAIAAAPGSEMEVPLQVTCYELAQAFHLPYTAALILTDDKTQCTVVGEYLAPNYPSLLDEIINLSGNPLAQHLLELKTPVLIPDVQNDPRLAAYEHLIKPRRMVSVLVMPLLVDRQMVGLLALTDNKTRQFAAEEISLIQRVAEELSGALARWLLTRTRQRLLTAFDRLGEGVIITDVGGTVNYVNAAVEPITGYSPVELIGRHTRILRSGKQPARFYQEMWAAITAGQSWHNRIINKKKDGSFYTADVTIAPVHDENGVIVNFVAIQRDVTRELQLEQQYHQAQKMEAIGLLAGGVAHDFNNLLTAMNGFAELAQMKLEPNHPVKELIDLVLRSGRRATTLTRQLLTFGRKDLVEPHVLNLNDVIVEVEKMMRRIIGENIQLESGLAPDLWPVKSDPAHLEQIVLNLLVNARDAMPGGGKLTVETRNVILDEDFVSAHLDMQPGNHVLLTVTDTGCGMSQEVQAHIFEPFFTTKPKGKGTGLGLSTVFGVVKQNGGAIWVYSEENVGTTFKVYLPGVSCPEQKQVQNNARLDAAGGSETILLVEDDAAVRDLTRRVLQAAGYTLLEAATGQEAQDIFYRNHTVVDLLLSDLILPDTNGKNLADEFVLARSNLKVLFMSGYNEKSADGFEWGALGYGLLSKPFAPHDLTRRIRSTLDS